MAVESSFTRQIFLLQDVDAPGAQHHKRSFLCDSSQPDVHIPGYREALQSVASAVGASELQLSLDRNGLDIITHHSLFYMLLAFARGAPAEFEVNSVNQPIIYYKAVKAAGASALPATVSWQQQLTTQQQQGMAAAGHGSSRAWHGMTLAVMLLRSCMHLTGNHHTLASLPAADTCGHRHERRS